MNRDQADTIEQELDSYQKIARRAGEPGNQKRSGPKPSNQEPSDRAAWMRFAAAAGASLSAATSAEAAITWVVPPQPIRAELLAGYTSINLDGDLDYDVAISANAFGSGIYNTFVGLADGVDDDTKLIGDQLIRNQFISIKKFASGAVIPAVEPALAGSVLHSMVTVYSNPITQYANWELGQTGIAGFVQGPVGARRAGWIKIRTESDGGVLGAVEVLEWAYESVPGLSIVAGQTSSAAIPGDYNGNGSVGPEDYTKWKADFGLAVVAGTGSDGNENAKVDAADYTVWRDNLDAFGSASLSGAVPEPSAISLGMLALGAAGVTALRRR